MAALKNAVGNEYPLTPLQEGMLLHSLSEPGVGMYFNQVVYNMEDLDIDAMRVAWMKLLERYEILRSSFHWEDLPVPIQRVEEEIDDPIRIEDWSGISANDRQMRLRELLNSEKREGFDFTKAPLIRITLVKRSNKDWLYIFSHHHLLLDGWSKNQINSELRAFYDSAKKGSSIDLPEPVQFREYVKYLQGRDVEEDRTFWREYLSGVVPLTRLPGERLGRENKKSRVQFGEWVLEIDRGKKDNLIATARECKVTLNSLIIGVWAVLLARYADQDDVVFGMLVSGRPASMEGVDSMVGMFLNAIPVRIQIGTNIEFREWIKGVQKDQTSLKSQEQTPLRQIQEYCGIPSGSPLYECIVVNTNTVSATPSNDFEYGKKKSSQATRAIASSVQQNVPLHLDLETIGDDIIFKMTYDARRFSRESIARVMEQYSTLLDEVVSEPGKNIMDLSMTSEAEYKLLRDIWNDTSSCMTQDYAGIHDIFVNSANRWPGRIAIIDGERLISYSELEEKSRRVALALLKKGFAGKILGISIKRSIEAAIAILGVLRSGSSYVPLDPSYPQERIEFMVSDSGAAAILVNDDTNRIVEDKQILRIEELCEFMEGEANELEKCRTVLDNNAYILYTSGSTGLPKGIAIPHRVAVNRLSTEPIPVEEGERFCAKTSLSFVDSIWEMFTAWKNGSVLTIIPEHIVPDVENFVEAIRNSCASRIVLVPSLLRSILYSGLDIAERLQCVNYWISSGEKLPEDLSSKFAEIFPEKTLVNIYGTSEVWDVTAQIEKGISLKNDIMPIGKPMGNVQCYIVDNDMRLVPIGINGRLLVGGLGVPNGYWKNDQLTEARFIDNLFGGGLLYKTGDIARWRPDGAIELIGREDTQVKIRGYRVEIEEIESALRRVDFIDEAVVWVKNNDTLNAGLICSSKRVDLSTIRNLAAQYLPDFMIPSGWFLLKSVPKNPNGKVDRLRAEEFILDPIKDESVVSDARLSVVNTEYADIITKTWSEILGKQIGYTDNVFHHGAHSLSATRASIRIGKELDKKIPLRVLFENPSPVQLSQWLVQSEDEESEEWDLVEIKSQDRRKEEPLSYNQKRLWFLYHLDPTNIAYTVPNSFEINGDLNVSALERALRFIIQRHESLRTTFISNEGVPYQLINSELDFKLEFTELGINTNQITDIRQEENREFMRRPWDLANGPLIRAKLIRSDADKHTLLLSMHHIITDGHSMGIIAEELQACYKAFIEDKTPSLADVGLQYADYARWENEWLEGKHVGKRLDFWKDRLNEIADIDLPLDYPRANDSSHLVDTLEFVLEKDVKEALEGLGVETDATIFMVLLTGFQILLGMSSGQEDVYIGTPVSNRDRAELQRVVGFFVNTVIIGTIIDFSESLRDAVCRVKQECLDAFANVIPFDKIVDELKPPREAGKNPLFQVMYVHQNEAGGLRLGNTVSSQQTRKDSSDFDLLFSTTLTSTDLKCTLQYRSALFTKETIASLASILRSIYSHMAIKPDEHIADICLITSDERAKLLSWGQPTSTNSRTEHIIDWIQQAVVRNPFAIAAEDSLKCITYSELDRQSLVFANFLLSEDKYRHQKVVALCVEKEVHMLIALFGILRAGKAVMAIDPEYPVDRINLMLEESSCQTVVTQQCLKHKLDETEFATALVVLDAFEDWRATKLENTSARIGSSDLAYISFTSGSTGKPKGVLVEHRNVVAMIEAQLNHFEINESSRILQVLSLSFDAGLAEIFRSVAAGATLVLADRKEIMPGPEFIRLLKEKHISKAAIPPVMLGALPEGSSEELTELKTVITGGEACQPHTARIWAKNRTLIIGYGTTETANGTLFAKSWDLQKKPPLGRPLENSCIYILNEKKNMVPVGIPGDIYIGGKGVSRGYLNRSELTEKVFINDPFSSEYGGRMYATGDRGRWLADGSVEYLGRKDSQVKIRGHRIELNEISEVIQLNEAVNQCLVVVNSESNIKRLFAYVTPAISGQTLSNTELKEFARMKLPDYMVPAAFMTLRKLPVTPNGKIDYRSLPKPRLNLLTDESTYTAPKTENEIKLAAIWCKVLGLERISIDANFFEFGGDSILSVQVVAQSTASGIAITVKDIFEYQTIRLLAEFAENAKPLEVDQSLVVGVTELTPIQYWHLQNNNESPSQYNHVMTIPLPRAYFKGNIIEDAVKYVWAHHDALRARFQVSNQGIWSKEILGSTDYPIISIHDITYMDPTVQDDFITRQIELSCKEIDIVAGPIARLEAFYRRDQKTSFVTFVIHHLVTDIISWQIIIEDFQTCLRYLAGNQRPELSNKSTSYKDWAKTLLEFALSESILSESVFWLSDARRRIRSLPEDRTSDSNLYADSSTHIFDLSVSDTKALLGAISSQKQYTVQISLLSALGVAFSRWSGNQDILIDVEGHGREESHFEGINLSRTVGWFTSFYPLLLSDINHNASAIASISKSFEDFNSIPKRGLGYGVLRYLVKDEGLREQICKMPQSQIAFNYIGINNNKRQEPMSAISRHKNLSIGQIKLIQGENKQRLHNFEIIAGIANEQLSMRITYNKKAYNESTVSDICTYFEEYLTRLTTELVSI